MDTTDLKDRIGLDEEALFEEDNAQEDTMSDEELKELLSLRLD